MSRRAAPPVLSLDFVRKRPKKRFLKADEAKRAAFVQMYAELRQTAEAERATIFFVDEAHFRADVELRAKWVPRGKPALADTTSPRRGEKATYYSAVCLETGQTEVMNVTQNLTAGPRWPSSSSCGPTIPNL